MVGGRFWRPKAGGGGGFCWIILRFAIGGSIWGAKFALEKGGLRLEGEVRELLVDGRREAGLELDVRAEEKD